MTATTWAFAAKTTHEMGKPRMQPRMKPRIKLLILKENHANHAWNDPPRIGACDVLRVVLGDACVPCACVRWSVVAVVSVVSMTYVDFMRGFKRGFCFSSVVFKKLKGGEAWGR